MHLTVKIQTTQGRRSVFMIEVPSIADVDLPSLVDPALWAEGDELDRIELIHAEVQPPLGPIGTNTPR